MTAALVVVSLLALLGWTAAAAVAWKWYVLGRRMLDVEERIEWSLDRLDMHYGRLAKVLEVPVASDDPTAREAVAAIKAAYDDVLVVANELVTQTDDQGVGEEDDDS